MLLDTQYEQLILNQRPVESCVKQIRINAY